MLKDSLSSFWDNIKQKTTNPFLGTFIIVWIVRNWEFVYSLFNFDAGTNLNDKIVFISKTMSPKLLLVNLICCVGISIVVIVVTYLLLNISRLITNAFEKNVTPWVYKITDRSSVVLKSEFQKIVEERDSFARKFQEERKSRIAAEGEIERLEKRNLEVSSKEDKISPALSEINEKKYSIDDETRRMYKMLENEKLIKDIESINGIVKNRTIIDDSSWTYRFAELDIIEVDREEETGVIYKFTKRGKKLIDHYLYLKYNSTAEA